jgi:hypothetical protein
VSLRPRGSHKHSKPELRLVIATLRVFGARRTEQQPRRLRSPNKSTAWLRLKAELQTFCAFPRLEVT